MMHIKDIQYYLPSVAVFYMESKLGRATDYENQTLNETLSIGISLPYPTNDGPVADTELALFVCRVQLTNGAVCIAL